MFGQVLLLSFLSLGMGIIQFSSPYRGEKIPGASLAPHANQALSEIAFELLKKFNATYDLQGIVGSVEYFGKSLYAYGVISDLPGSTSICGPFGSCAFSVKFQLHLENVKVEGLPKSETGKSLGDAKADQQATDHIKEIQHTLYDSAKEVTEVLPDWDLSDPAKGFILLGMGELPSFIEAKMMWARETLLIEYGVSHYSLDNYQPPVSGGANGYIRATIFAYQINEPKEDVPETMIPNIIQGITDWRNLNFYPPFQVFPSSHKHPSAQMVAVAWAFVRRYGQKIVVNNTAIVEPTISYVKRNMDMGSIRGSAKSIKGQNKDWFMKVEVPHYEGPHLDFLSFIIKELHPNPELPNYSPVELDSFTENTLVHASFFQKLLLTSDNLGVGVLRQENRVIFVLHTTLNPLLTDDWKFPMMAYLNNSIAQQQNLKNVNNNNQIEVHPGQLPEAELVEVKQLMEPFLKDFVACNAETTTDALYGLGVSSNIGDQGGLCVFSYKLEYKSPGRSLHDSRFPQCAYSFMEGNTLKNKALSGSFTDIISRSVTATPSTTLPIWKIWNESTIIFYESRVPSSLAIHHMVCPSTLRVTFGVLTFDHQELALHNIPIATVFFCHKILPEFTLPHFDPLQVFAQITTIQKTRGCQPLEKRSESSLAQLFVNALPYIPWDSDERSGLLKTRDSWLIYLDLTDDRKTVASKIVGDAVTKILNSTNYKDLATTPAELLKAEPGYHQASSFADACLIAKTPMLDFAISTFERRDHSRTTDNRVFFVIETKLVDEGNKWRLGSAVFDKMINNLKDSGAKPVSKKRDPNPQIDAFAKRLFTRWKPNEQNSITHSMGLGVLYCEQPGLICGPSSHIVFSYRVESYPSPRSIFAEQGKLVELQKVAQIKSILETTDEQRVQLQWLDKDILMFQAGVQSSNLDFLQITSPNLTSLEHGAYAHVTNSGLRPIRILTVLVYQGTQSQTVLTSSTDKPVEDFINSFKLSQLFRTVQLSKQNFQAQKLAYAMAHLTQKDPTKPEGTVVSSGLVRILHSWFILIEVSGENIHIETVLQTVREFWQRRNTNHKLSPQELTTLSIDQIYWNLSSIQLSLVLASNIISYGYAIMNRRSFLVLHLSNLILPTDWTTPLDSVKKTLTDLRHLVKAPPVPIRMIQDWNQEQLVTQALKRIEGRAGKSSGFSVFDQTAISHLKINGDLTQPENIFSPVLSLLNELFRIAKGGEMSNDTIPSKLLFSGGPLTEGFIPVWDVLSLLDVSQIMKVDLAYVTFHTSWHIDSNGNLWDVVLLISPVPVTFLTPHYSHLGLNIIPTYLKLNHLPKYIEDLSLFHKIPSENTEYDQVVKYNLSEFHCSRGFAIKYLSRIEFPAKFSEELIHLGLSQVVLQEALKCKLLSNLNGTLLRVGPLKGNQYRSIFVDAGKDGSIKWFHMLNTTFNKASVWDSNFSRKAEDLKTYLSKTISVENIKSTFGSLKGEAVSIIDLKANEETYSVDKILSERVNRLNGDLPIAEYICQGVIELKDYYVPLFGSFSKLDQYHLRNCKSIGVAVLIHKSDTVLLIIVYSTMYISRIGNALLYKITNNPSGREDTFEAASLSFEKLSDTKSQLIVTSGFIGSCFHCTSDLTIGHLNNLRTFFALIVTPSIPLTPGWSLPVIVTDRNNIQSLQWKEVDPGLHQTMARTYHVNRFTTRMMYGITIFMVIYDPPPSIETFELFISEFLKTLIPSSVTNIEFSKELSCLAGALGVSLTLKFDPNLATFVSLGDLFGIVVPLDGKQPLPPKAREIVVDLLTADKNSKCLKKDGVGLVQTDIRSLAGLVSNRMQNEEKLIKLIASSKRAGGQIVVVEGTHVGVIVFERNKQKV